MDHPSMTEIQRRFRIPQGRLRLVLAVTIALAFLTFLWTRTAGLPNNAEESALNSIRLHGSTSVSYQPGELYDVLSRVLGDRARFFCWRRLSINMEPQDFTDNTIDELMAVRNLDRIFLYEKNTKPGTRLAIVPLENAATAVTPRGIARFQQHFPHVTIHVTQNLGGVP